jgi:Carboxypeptidase regulatory-like domain
MGGTQARVVRAVLAALAVSTANAQSPRTVVVTGIAFDSLRGVPLSGAFVSASGAEHSTTSDSLGIFQLELAPGTHTVAILHPAFDSLGLSGTSVRAVVSDGRDTIRLALPSFATLWRLACGTGAAPPDSGFVFGSVRNAGDQRPISGATIVATWIDVGLDSARGVTQRRWRSTVLSDSTGGFALCGMPPDESISIAAEKDSASTGTIELQPSMRRVQRRDVYVASPNDPLASRGLIAGLVRDAGGTPLAGARVVTEGAAEVRSGNDGKFLLTDVPIGTREVEVLFVGSQPNAVVVDVLPRDTARVDVTLQKVTELPTVNVTALSVRQRRLDDLAERIKSKMGQFIDSTTIERYATFGEAVHPLLGSFPICALYVDGVKTPSDLIRSEVYMTSAPTIAIVEMHAGSDIELPFEFRSKSCRSHDSKVVLIWTKRWLP